MPHSIPVRISVNDGPVTLANGCRTGVSASCPLWDSIVGFEEFPADAESAFYKITLEKPVSDFSNVRRAEQELTEALLSVAAAWPFSGGSHLMLENRTIILSHNFSSNAAIVEERLMEDSGSRIVSAHSTGNIGFGSTYAQPPLALAARIAVHMREDFETSQLLGYYQKAYSDTFSWFIHLYKILDVLKRIYPNSTRASLGIDLKEWTAFESLLNTHDLRHPPKKIGEPEISNLDKGRLYSMTRRWISAHLVKKGLTVI